MRAIQISSYGAPSEVIGLVEIDEPPRPWRGQVLLGMDYAPISMHDLYVAQGLFPVRPQAPSVIGNEGVGRVLAVGPEVEGLRVGDRVLAPLFSMTWRERLVVDAAGLFPLPEEADPRQLSMLGINPPTASLILSEYVDLQPGDWVVQNAANSGVGRSLIAIAKQRGLRTINFVRRAELVDELLAAGGDIVALDRPDELARIAQIVGSGRVRLGVDGVAGKATTALTRVMTEQSVLLAYAVASGEPMAVNMLDLVYKRMAAYGFYLGHPEHAEALAEAVAEAAPLVISGQLHVPIAATYPLEAIKEAVAHAQRGGKVLLEITASA
uniref:enoyl-[acyl-carrier-protein] reductase n=1 Tax=Caulobacter sp. (strain K31) TaxID=366602 RepID=B0T958_CAUSK